MEAPAKTPAPTPETPTATGPLHCPVMMFRDKTIPFPPYPDSNKPASQMVKNPIPSKSRSSSSENKLDKEPLLFSCDEYFSFFSLKNGGFEWLLCLPSWFVPPLLKSRLPTTELPMMLLFRKASLMSGSPRIQFSDSLACTNQTNITARKMKH